MIDTVWKPRAALNFRGIKFTVKPRVARRHWGHISRKCGASGQKEEVWPTIIGMFPFGVKIKRVR